MSSFVGSLYCSAVTRKWTNDTSEDHILFIICNPNTAKPFLWRSSDTSELNSIKDDDQFKPLPFVKGNILNSPKMVAYPWTQLKEFIHLIPHKAEFGEGEHINPPPKSKLGERSQTIGTQQPHQPQQQPQRQQVQRIQTQGTQPQPQSQQPPSPLPALSTRPREPALEAIKLSESSLSFLNEPDFDPSVASGSATSRKIGPGSRAAPSAPLSAKDTAALDGILEEFEKLSEFVEDFDDSYIQAQQQEEQEGEQASPFSEVGIASFLGLKFDYEDDKFKPPKIERKKAAAPPPPSRTGRTQTLSMMLGAPGGAKPTPPSNRPPPLNSNSSSAYILPDIVWDSNGQKLVKSDWMELVGKSATSSGLGASIINLFAALSNIVSKSKKTSPTVFITNCDFYPTLVKDPAKLHQFVEELDFGSFDRLVIPILTGSHVTLGVISDNHFDYYDSLGKSGEEVTKNLSKFFKEFCKTAKKDSRAKKPISSKKWDNLKLVQHYESTVHKKGSDSGIFALFFAQSVSEKKPPTLPPSDARAKVAHKVIELMQYLKPLEGAALKELSALADASPAVDVVSRT